MWTAARQWPMGETGCIDARNGHVRHVFVAMIASSPRAKPSNAGVPIMRAVLPTAIAVFLALAAPVHAQTTAPVQAPRTPGGLWQAVDDDTKQPTGWFLISNHNGIWAGIIAKMFLKPGEDPNAACDKCTDDRANHPWLGLEIIRDMKQDKDNPDKYVDGNILDPRDGKVYHALMTLSPDNQTLIVRGYLGFEMLGKNQYWTRLPDSDMSQLDPSVNPNAAAAAPANKPPVARKPAPAAPPATAH
jgi:uncharacterized protein (DUF2147 family)